ncbi:hypothetical protein SUVZ_05G1070 [Saccharomyces uvarum]|uniref:Uncharacterized protein n=1 Tax=Saccharomyces uvarum TaxID=230603 RepID=A0ABN8WS84_SACUV|nr:hypothetical protein SUVZ_05G1070 [Saccharomyces uvarum]
MGPDTKHSAKAKILTKKSSPSTKEHIRPRKPQVAVPPAQNLPNGDRPNFGNAIKQHREPRERTTRVRPQDADTTMVTVNIDGFLSDKTPKKKSSKNKKKKSRHPQDGSVTINSKPQEATHTVFAGASFTTDIPHETALPKPSFV